MGENNLLGFLESTRFLSRAAKGASEYRNAQPFPHAYLDSFLPDDVLKSLLKDFEALTKAAQWGVNKHEYVDGKFWYRGPWLDFSSQFFSAMNSGPMLNFLETLTGISGLLADPDFIGGGFHRVHRDGFLEVHSDFNAHPTRNWLRRINLLLFLNPRWETEWGGHLELWPRDVSTWAHKFLPLWNRCVIFNTTDTSYHGHPHPLWCPSDTSRKSVALYYYTVTPPDTKTIRHCTLYQKRQS